MYPDLIKYSDYQESVPKSGHHILAHQTDDAILVYQAYNYSIADFAIANQSFGGSSFSYARMSWIKPNFLWMMYRCGWAEKINQERVLGIWIKKSGFNKILKEAVYSSYQESIYGSHDNWKLDLEKKEVRLQWDPDHDVFGKKEERRAIQLGLKGAVLQKFGKEMIIEIIDMTKIAKEQKLKIDAGNIEEVMIPKEWSYEVKETDLKKKLKLNR